MSKIKLLYLTLKEYVLQLFRIPRKINNIVSDLEEIKIVLSNINYNICEMKDVDFITIGK